MISCFMAGIFRSPRNRNAPGGPVLALSNAQIIEREKESLREERKEDRDRDRDRDRDKQREIKREKKRTKGQRKTVSGA